MEREHPIVLVGRFLGIMAGNVATSGTMDGEMADIPVALGRGMTYPMDG